MAKEQLVAGKVVWHDLVTQDIDTALGFYTELVGWTYTPHEMGPEGTYHMITVGGRTIGGFMKPREELPSHWLAYTSVADVDRAAETVKRFGGQVPLGPMDIPNVGRFAVTLDPQGAAMCPFKATQWEMPAEEPRERYGEFCWDEVMVDDVEAAKAFYGEVYGWRFQKMEMGPGADYWVATVGEGGVGGGVKQVAGLMKKPPEVLAPPSWLTYVYVEDLDVATDRVATLGGKVLMSPMPIPDMGRFSVIQDSVGAAIGLFGAPRK